ncbi:Zinc finger E-box-binding homeobox 2 [Entomophthora muscae]|uniref:Zinc finger E-box-binding homeobox 2 n=1 Tax=Entomophthora muscae TaxID=34485 RepID=A0ACC2T2H7_9FUNG|nr:Zinc finger E-box-binding homeobox 2 [Entomophthora muscae]
MKKCPNQARVRTKFSKLQIDELEALYTLTSKPTKDQMADLGNRIELELRIIQVWFQNRRVKERNQHLSQFEAPLPPPPCLSYVVKLMHMPTSNSVTFHSPPIVPSSQFNHPPMCYPNNNMYLTQAVNPYSLPQNYIYIGDLNQSLSSQ